jgi:hypothetical protein
MTASFVGSAAEFAVCGTAVELREWTALRQGINSTALLH